MTQTQQNHWLDRVPLAHQSRLSHHEVQTYKIFDGIRTQKLLHLHRGLLLDIEVTKYDEVIWKGTNQLPVCLTR